MHVQRIAHILSVDIECPARIFSHHFAGISSPPSSTLYASTTRLLDILALHAIRATFFVLATVALRFPQLIRTVSDAGHEVALHGFDHEALFDLTPAAFRQSLIRAKHHVEDIVGAPVVGYRAPYLSLREVTAWSLDVLREQGFLYDSSAFPTLRRAGRLRIPSEPFCLANGLVEIPATCLTIGGFGLPAAGGGYLRHFPQWWTHAALAQAARAGRAACVYVHPYEFDRSWVSEVQHLRSWRARLAIQAAVHHAGVAMEDRFRRLLSNWTFQTARAAADRVAEPSTVLMNLTPPQRGSEERFALGR